MLCACAHGPDTKDRVAPAIKAYYKFHHKALENERTKLLNKSRNIGPCLPPRKQGAPVLNRIPRRDDDDWPTPPRISNWYFGVFRSVFAPLKHGKFVFMGTPRVSAWAGTIPRWPHPWSSSVFFAITFLMETS